MKIKISLTSKLVVGVVFILAVALAVLERKASGILLSDKRQTLKNQSSQVSYSLAVAVAEKVKRLDRHLRLILTHSALNTPLELRPRGEDMLLVGSISRSFGQSWETNWIIGPTENKSLEGFVRDFTTNIQKTIYIDQVRGDEYTFARLMAADGQPLFAMLIRLSRATDATEKIATAILSPSVFFDLVAPFKGSLTTAFLVDQTGTTYAHPNLSLTGTSLRGNQIVQRVVQKFSATQQEEFQEGNETFIGTFDNVSRTNLSAITTISLTKAALPLRELKWSFAVLGVGLLFLAVLLAVYISYLLKSPLLKLRRVVDDLASGKRTFVEPNNSEAELSDLAVSLNELDKKLRIKDAEVQTETQEKIYKEKMSAFHRLSSGLVNELRNPLIGILGHTQLAREKIRDPESIRRHLDLIERDVRKTKDLIEDISQFSGADKLEVSSINIYEALTAAIEQAGRKILPQNISILKNLESVSSVTANAVLLRKALLNLLSCCGQLVQVDGNREIAVRLESDGADAKITVIFESKVLSSNDLGRIFDPFTKTEGEIELGLDLALAKGIFEAHDSSISIEQTGEVHFQFVVRIPKVKELPMTEVSSPFSENPGLELKGLSFALPDFSLGEQSQKRENQTNEEILNPPERPLEPKIITRQIMSKVPLENLKIKIRKPTIRA